MMDRGTQAHVRFVFQRLGRHNGPKNNYSKSSGVKQCLSAKFADPGAYKVSILQ
jgi:hypothetical protein